MKLNEMRNLSTEELYEQVREKKRELMDLRFQASIGQLAQNHRIRETKRTIARLLTVIREKQQAAE
ncbi:MULTISPECIES: 50S ribosomal protein L29 [Oceanithermus]|jgi:large subunit ribosomal protein L29|uniref:Large ribosomal subunit protein uL29 n=3 Tax=Oceanithermus TaxID=208447 RepID=E4U9H7_OCEP5|nr:MULTISPECIES: 50S ribosomal protein L29 [Oceanithermus]ADR37073.1 LSU ribosomal protein L29P [Oceanithermus profundus DSM 14977]MBB6028661.1 large subunit ribosomal protein L29 [Oceanithermus desulfurans]GEM90296.1 50S ribosomal protein L29 [Oceanithermus desulfurans NBRC 100063]